eukprot:550388_1
MIEEQISHGGGRATYAQSNGYQIKENDMPATGMNDEMMEMMEMMSGGGSHTHICHIQSNGYHMEEDVMPSTGMNDRMMMMIDGGSEAITQRIANNENGRIIRERARRATLTMTLDAVNETMDATSRAMQ